MRKRWLSAAVLLLTGCRMQVQNTVPADHTAAAQSVPAVDAYAAAWAESVHMFSAPEKALLLHDHIINRVTFDRTAARRHTAEGALLDRLAVCDGYASAFCLLGDAAGLSCITVIGSKNGIPHAWNLVYLDDGWYHVDCAADDTDCGAPLHTAFLLADSEMQGYVWDAAAYPKAAGTVWNYGNVISVIQPV